MTRYNKTNFLITIHNYKLCYDLLIENGITVQSTYNGFVYSHQKYWIIDSETVYLCTGKF